MVGADTGSLGLRFTVDGGERITGVAVAAAGEGTYDVSLHLVAGLIPLQGLADAIRRRVGRAAKAAGLDPMLGRIDIRFEDIDPAAVAGPVPQAGR